MIIFNEQLPKHSLTIDVNPPNIVIAKNESSLRDAIAIHYRINKFDFIDRITLGIKNTSNVKVGINQNLFKLSYTYFPLIHLFPCNDISLDGKVVFSVSVIREDGIPYILLKGYDGTVVYKDILMQFEVSDQWINHQRLCLTLAKENGKLDINI